MSFTPPDPRSNIQRRIREVLRPTLVTPPVLKWLDHPGGEPLHLIIELNNKYPGGLMAARVLVENFVRTTAPHALDRNLPGAQHSFVFAQLKPFELAAILQKDSVAGRLAQTRDPDAPLNAEPVVYRESRAIRKVWESTPIRPLTTVSIRTVKADAAHAAFTALGQGITWAVLDSGIQADHPHFTQFATLKVAPPLMHRSFAPPRADGTQFNPLEDEFGHGTHVAGIIAGGAMPNGNSLVARQSVDASGRNPEFHLHPVGPICGMAPKCKLLSLRVLDDLGNGDVTSVINALEWLIQLNGDGSSPRVHGVNLSAGAASLGDLLTYYTMKDRAGIVGRTGAVGTVRALLKSRAPAAAPKVHLVGHSFGGRLVTSAANSLNGSTGATAPESVDSMMLLEAAYSHNGLAVNWDGKGSDGGFRSVIAQVKVKGPILISHSSHDFPVGTAYPIASRLRGQVADSLIGGPDDIYGGMGRNGAQHTPEVLTDVALASADGSANYPPAPNKPSWILNIRGDGPPPAPTITGHGDVAKPELVATLLNYI